MTYLLMMHPTEDLPEELNDFDLFIGHIDVRLL